MLHLFLVNLRPLNYHSLIERQVPDAFQIIHSQVFIVCFLVLCRFSISTNTTTRLFSLHDFNKKMLNEVSLDEQGQLFGIPKVFLLSINDLLSRQPLLVYSAGTLGLLHDLMFHAV